MVGFRGNSQRAMHVFVYVSVVFIKIGGSHMQVSPYNPSPYRIPCKPKHRFVICCQRVHGCVFVGGWVEECGCVSMSVCFHVSVCECESQEKDDEVSATEGNMFSFPLPGEWKTLRCNDSIREMGVKP